MKKDNVGFYATRNIFNTKRRYYNAYIYKLNSSKLIIVLLCEKIDMRVCLVTENYNPKYGGQYTK